MSDEEVRVTSDTGGQKGKKLARFDLLPVGPLTEVAKLYGQGATKYADRNWELGYDWSLSFAAMQRHAWEFWGGQSIDPENRRHHLASVVFHAMALMEYEARGKGTDDRPIVLAEAAAIPAWVHQTPRITPPCVCPAANIGRHWAACALSEAAE